VSEDGGAIPAPLILDASVLIAVARGDAGIMTPIQGYDADGQPMVIPAMAVTAALLDRPGEDAEALPRRLLGYRTASPWALIWRLSRLTRCWMGRCVPKERRK
jgi:hypothetical protein